MISLLGTGQLLMHFPHMMMMSRLSDPKRLVTILLTFLPIGKGYQLMSLATPVSLLQVWLSQSSRVLRLLLSPTLNWIRRSVTQFQGLARMHCRCWTTKKALRALIVLPELGS